MDSRCRLCGESCTGLSSIFEHFELPNKIFSLYQVKVNLDDPLTTSICLQCWEIVQNSWNIYIKVQKAQKLLTDLLTSTDIHSSGFPRTSLQENSECQLENENENEPHESPVENNVKELSNKKKSLSKRGKPKKDVEHLSELSVIELNEDGSCLPKEDLFSWQSYPWVCCDCPQNFSSSDDLKNHYTRFHNQVSKYSCMDCQKVYSKYSTFISHVRVHHISLRYCCDVCYKWYPNIEALENHSKCHKEETNFVCLNCGKSFRLQSALLLHARSHLPAEWKNCHQCDQCPKRFGTKPNLMAHKRIHSGIRDYTCDQCGKSFFQKGNLENHLLTHTAVRPFSCTICNKTFKTMIRLKKHCSVHSGLKPHKCNICGRQFRERGTLKEHERIHTGAMPFTCKYCGKSFRFKGVLTTHLRQHTGERPYSCHECQHHFTNWPNYNKHMKRRHGINTSVTVRKPQTIPPTGMPERNPPGTVLAQPIQNNDSFVEQTAYYPVLGIYNISEENVIQEQRV